MGIGKWSALHTLVVVIVLVIAASFLRGVVSKLLWWAAVAVLAIHALAESSR